MPNDVKPPSAEEIFYRCLELHEEGWTGYLDDVCGNDDALRAEVESLLASHEKGKILFDVSETVPSGSRFCGRDDSTMDEDHGDRRGR